MSSAARPTTDLGPLTKGPGHSSLAVPRPRSRWRTRVLLPLAIFLLAGGLLGYAARDVLVAPVAVHVVPVVARSAQSEAVSQPGSAESAPAPRPGPAVQAPGWVEPDPYATNVPAMVDGIVRDVLVLEGDTITQGQVVAHLVDEELRLAERSAAAVVAERQADVVRAKAGIEPVRAAIGIAQSEVDMLKDEIARKKELVALGGVPAGEFSRLEIRKGGAEARILQAKSELAASEASTGQAEAALETAKALHAEAQLRLSRTEVRSPAAGVVLARLVAPGTRIAMTSRSAESADMTSTLLRLYDPMHLQVRADVPLADAARIGVGTPAEVTTEALPGQKFAAKVSRVVHEANIQRNTVQFKVAIENPSPQLKPEMLTRVRFNPGSTARSGSAAPVAGSDDSGLQLVLPATVLVQRSDAKAQVWLVEASGSASSSTAVMRTVTLGDELDGEVVILSGVKPGDRAIVDPPNSLQSGTRVRVLGESASSTPGKPSTSH